METLGQLVYFGTAALLAWVLVRAFAVLTGYSRADARGRAVRVTIGMGLAYLLQFVAVRLKSLDPGAWLLERFESLGTGGQVLLAAGLVQVLFVLRRVERRGTAAASRPDEGRDAVAVDDQCPSSRGPA